MTRKDLLRATAGSAAAWTLVGLPGFGCSAEPKSGDDEVPAQKRYFLTEAEAARLRDNVDDPAKPWIAAAYRGTRRLAEEGLAVRPSAPDPAGAYIRKEEWFEGLYQPGLVQGRYVWAQALTHAVTGEDAFREGAKGFMLEWASRYAWPEGEYGPRVGHMVAEPVGFMVKAFLAYDLVREGFSASERQTFERWAQLFIRRGMHQADHARDEPWTPTAAVTNGATWARCLAVCAAAASGPSALQEALAWNWSHRTRGTNDDGEAFAAHPPLEYGWPWLIENAMHPTGQMIEEQYRRSIDYGLYAWQPLHLIADVDRHAGEGRLYGFQTPSGKSLHRVMEYYVPYLTEQVRSPYATSSDPDADGVRRFSTAMSAHRASAEKFRNAFSDSPVLAEIVHTGGTAQRARNFDEHIVAYGALLGEFEV